MTSSTTRYGCSALLLVLACAPAAPRRAGPAGAPDPLILGEFADDYGSRFTITAAEWFQHLRSRYHIVRWRPDSQYLIARNDARNPSGAKLWTRIDWLRLPGMPPFTWGFCLSTYEAPTPAAAESSHVARRETPAPAVTGSPSRG